MEETGLLKAILPELAACRGVEQKGYHKFDVLDHSVYALEAAARNGYEHEVRLAALFHDIGKPAAARKDNEESGVWTFYQHERHSAEMTAVILRRLRYPNAVAENVVHLIKEHMFNYEDNWGNAAVRRFLARVGKENIEPLFRLRLADGFGQGRVEPDPRGLMPFMRRLEAQMTTALSVKDLAISGKDLIEAGIAPGKGMGLILGRLLEAVLDDPALNEKEKLLEIAAKMRELS
jgi:putative nucleotidyltransferase with HDIG domain